ncbi:MAG: histidine phosphatase family protein [Candidatus Omnitrophica bacterium]|nr:histidine phosphatase family protein [Candidatus Omnitrophota bacterium]
MGKVLYLLRHAKAGRDDVTIDDRDRPLNERGEQDAPEMGRRLRRRGSAPAAIVSSPARRAYATAERVARQLHFPLNEIIRAEELYVNSLAGVIEVVQGLADDWEQVIVCGHNPSFTEAANFFCRDRQFARIPTCGVVCIDFAAESWRNVRAASGTLVFFECPERENSAPG